MQKFNLSMKEIKYYGNRNLNFYKIKKNKLKKIMMKLL